MDLRMSNETFLEFLTRSAGLGRTSWAQLAFLGLFILGLLCAGVTTWHYGGWVAVLFAAAIVAVLIYGSWRNFKGKQA